MHLEMKDIHQSHVHRASYPAHCECQRRFKECQLSTFLLCLTRRPMWSLDNEAGQHSGSTPVTQELPVANELNLTGVSTMFLRTAPLNSAQLPNKARGPVWAILLVAPKTSRGQPCLWERVLDASDGGGCQNPTLKKSSE